MKSMKACKVKVDTGKINVQDICAGKCMYQ